MYCKKIKTVGIFFFTILYLFTVCLGSSSFATSSRANYENVEERHYYIKNAANNLYAGALDFFSMVLDSYRGDSQQQWELIYVSNGYYNIKNAYTEKYLTAPTDYSEGSFIEQSSLSTNAQMQNRQLWTFTQVGSQYYIQAKSHESSGMYLASSSLLNVYGYPLVQSGYSNNYIRWNLEPVKTAYLLGIDYDEPGHDHTSALTSASFYYRYDGYIPHLIITESTNAYTVKNYLKDSNVFIIRSHGGYDGIGTSMKLNESGTNTIHSWDIYNYTGNNGIDLTDCDVAAFVGCSTAVHPTQSLPHSAVNAGADVGIGFNLEIYCNEAETWTTNFSQFHSTGYNAINAAYKAAQETGENSTIALGIVIITQPN